MQAPPALLIEKWDGLTPYEAGMARMEAALAQVLAGGPERLIFCEHAPVLTVGSSGKMADVRGVKDIPVVATGRGGQVTYHGPGQRVVYPIVRLDRWGKDVRVYVKWLQNWVVDSLDDIGISSYINDDIGVWVGGKSGPEKIAAIGIRVRRGVAYHGVSINIFNDLSVYGRFVPCGIPDRGVARAVDLLPGREGASLTAELDQALHARF